MSIDQRVKMLRGMEFIAEMEGDTARDCVNCYFGINEKTHMYDGSCKTILSESEIFNLDKVPRMYDGEIVAQFCPYFKDDKNFPK